MKKKLTVFLLTLTCSLTACSSQTASSSQQSSTSTETVGETVQADSNCDLDISILDAEEQCEQAYYIFYNVDDYIGQVIKMSGYFLVDYDETNDKYHFGCLVGDEDYNIGIEFVAEEDYSYPDDYPEENTMITILGTVETYTYEDAEYLYLTNATFTVNEE